MKRMKKILALLLTIAMLLSVVPVTFAAEKPTVNITNAAIDLANETNQQVVVISIKNNPGIAGCQMNLSYDAENLAVMGITKATALPSTAFTVSPQKIAWAYLEQDFFGNTMWHTADGDMFMVLVAAKDGAVNGDYTFSILNTTDGVDDVFADENSDPISDEDFIFNVGTITITGGVTQDQITPAVSVTADKTTFGYGETYPILTADVTDPTVKGTMSGQWYCGETELTGETDAELQIKAAHLDGFGNYTFKYVVENTYKGVTKSAEASVEVTYEKTTITDSMVSLDTNSFTYDGDEKVVGVTVKNGETPLVEGEDKDYTVTGTTGTNAGNYEVVVTGKGNYEGTVKKSWKIEKAAITASAYDIPLYMGGMPHALSDAALNISTENSQEFKVSYALKDGDSFVTLEDGVLTAKAEGTAVVEATIIADNHADKKVDITVKVSSKEIKEDVELSVKDGMSETTYAAPFKKTLGDYINEVNSDGETVTYYINGVQAADGLNTAIPGAGEYAITAQYETTTQIHKTAEAATFTVKKAEVAVPEAAPLQPYTGSEQVAFTVAESDVYTASGDLRATNAGNYTAKFALKNDANYKWATDFSGSIDWIIERKGVDTPSAAEDLIFNAKERIGVPAAENDEYIITGNKEINANDSYTATATPTANYKWNGKEGAEATAAVEIKWSIAKAPVTITPDEDQSKVYGANDRDAFTYTTNLSDSLASDFASNVTGKLGRAGGEDVGSYAFNLGTLSATNYELTLADTNKFAITAMPLNEITTTVSAMQYVEVKVGTFTEPAFPATVGGASVDVEGAVTYTYNDKDYKTADDLKTALAGLDLGTEGKVTFAFNPTSSNYADGSVEGSFDFKVVDVAFEFAEGAITVKPAVYGTKWRDIVSFDSAKIKAKVGESYCENPDYELVDADEIPDVKDAAYVIKFSGTINGAEYSGITVKSESVVITPKNVTITGVASKNKDYDTTTNAVITGTAAVEGKLEGDTVTVVTGTAAFSDKNVGTGKTVIFDRFALSGNDAGNYNLSAQPAPVTADIDPVELTISDVRAIDRTYKQGDKIVELDGGALSDVLAADEGKVTVDLSAAKGEMADANVGTDKVVTVTGVKLGGDEAANYTLKAQPTGVTVDIDNAAAPTLNVSGTTEFKYTVTGEKTLTIADVPTGETIESVTFANVDNDDAVLTASPAWTSGSAFTIDLRGFESYNAGLDAKFDVKVKVSNHDEATIEDVTITILDRYVPTVAVEDITTTYNGSDVAATLIKGTHTYDGVVVEGTFAWGDLSSFVGGIKNAGTYNNVPVVFTPADAINYQSVDAVVAVLTIEKAMPIVTPNVTQPAAGAPDKVLSNFALTCTSSVDGNITWDDDSVEVMPGQAYAWTFIPEDTVNYKVVSGTIVAKKYSYVEAPSVIGNGVITPPATSEGSVTVSTTASVPGNTVVVYPRPAAGYKTESITVVDAMGNAIPVVANSNGTFSFLMPATGVQIIPNFVKDVPAPAPAVGFEDVAPNAWYYNAVTAAVEKGLFGGMTPTTFAPDAEMTRSMLVTVLWRLADEPAATASANFEDVALGQWYSEAVNWAAANSVVTGMTADIFGVTGNITREQMATMLYRYALYAGLNTTASADLSGYTDSGKISAYAEDAMSWAVANGLIGGMTADTLVPGGNATRAQVATILVRFAEKFGL